MQTSALLAAIVAASDDAIVSKDLNGIITSWNRGAERIFGFSAEEAVGNPITIIIPPDRAGEESRVLAKIRSGEAVDHLETVRRRKDGTLLDVSITVSPIRSEEGVVIGASKIARDITEQRRAARRLREEIRIVETLNRVGSTVAATLDREGVVQAVINAVTDLTNAAFGVFYYRGARETGEEYMRHSLSGPSKDAFARLPPSLTTELFKPTLTGERSIRLADIAAEEPFAAGLLRDGTPVLPMRSYLAVPVLAASGQVLGGLFFGHPEVDMFTERHQRLTEGIAGWAGVALENARFYEEANEANRMKDEFLAVLSHELRTPLNAIMGWADMLTSTRMDQESRLRALHSIQRNARVQAQLIEDLLDVSRIVAGKLALRHEHVDLAMVVSAAIEDLRAEMHDKQLALAATIADDPVVVTGDAQRLQQIVWNVLSNAIKFTPIGGSIEVMLGRVGEQAEVVVRDTGQGITAEFLPHVFDRFRQADSSTTRRHGGLGLGLGIVKHLIEAHGGIVTAASEGIGKGATFTVRLPLRRSVAASLDQRGREAPLSATQLPDVRALVVDDDRDAADLLVYALVQCGAQVTAVPSAIEGLRSLGRDSFNVLLADIGMPDVDGYQFIRTIRAREHSSKGPPIAAIAITAHAGPGDRERALNAGFDWHLTKPVVSRDVIAVVARVTTNGTRSRRQ
jgi:PAS domain S-box-containing protein